MDDPPPHRREVRIGEYHSAELPDGDLTDTDLERLEVLREHGALGLTPTRAGWRVTAGAVAGVLLLDRVRLTVEPKFALDGRQLITWLCYALAAPIPHRPTYRHWNTGRHGFADLAAAALVAECRTLLRGGLRRDYVRHDQVTTVLRGRLDTAAQVARRYGQLDRLHVRAFERDADIWENRLCGAALTAAARLTSDPGLARLAADTAALFPQPARPLPPGPPPTPGRARYTRLNARYRPAHTWADLILRGGGVADLFIDRGLRADTLLLSMPRLWEAAVRRMVAEAARPLAGHVVSPTAERAVSVLGDLAARRAFRPDVLLILGLGCGTTRLLPVDAKYKRYDRDPVEAADVHQMLTYVAGYAPAPTPRAVVVHPSPGHPTHRTLHVTGPRGRIGDIDVVGIDAHLPPEAGARRLQEVIAATSTGRRP